MDRVIVLMSTYNGEKYIREQLDSIFNQKNIAVKVVIRDDGSNDATQSILDEYKKKHNLNWYTGKNLNAAWSFMELINNAPDSNFYAFADQDDVWDNDKLFIAVEAMKNCGTETNEKAIMYSCPTRLVDEKLNSIGNLKHNNSYTSSFAGSL
ncbi:glycosyltransferase, partial [Enterococcus faecium]|nr:glycosyltransferase [Enterococcus faecium]